MEYQLCESFVRNELFTLHSAHRTVPDDPHRDRIVNQRPDVRSLFCILQFLRPQHDVISPVRASLSVVDIVKKGSLCRLPVIEDPSVFRDRAVREIHIPCLSPGQRFLHQFPKDCRKMHAHHFITAPSSLRETDRRNTVQHCFHRSSDRR